MIIDSINAGKTVRPESVEDLAKVIATEKGSIVPIGAGTQMHFGNPLRSADCVVDLTGLRRITAYNPAELTIHVEAGVTLGEIERALGENNQVLPLDPWNGPSATIGGIAAANAQGPLRATGTIRDWIIGMKVVHADGRISKTGGRVVKNVTGYDLAKLYTGSLGTLAVIAEISFKVRPRLGKTATARAQFGSIAEANEILTHIRKGPLQPISCEFVGPSHMVGIRFEEHPKAIPGQIAQLPKANWEVLEGEEEVAALKDLRAGYGRFGPIVLRVVGSASDIGAIVESYRPSAWIAHAMNGIVLMAVADPAVIRQVRERYEAIIEKAPLDVRREYGAFGVRGPARKIMEGMKQSYDPSGRLNPGRYIDGE
jgi:glycolate oxidase FAD binding subunit